MAEPNFLDNFNFSIFGQKGPKMDQKQGFSCFPKKIVPTFYFKCIIMKDDIVEWFLAKTSYQAKFLFLSFDPNRQRSLDLAFTCQKL